MTSLKRLTAVAVLIATLSGCGQVKSADDKVMSVQDNAATPASQTQLDASFNQIKQLLQLYSSSGDGNMTKAGLQNLFSRYKDKLEGFLSGSKLSANDFVDLLFSLDANHDGHLTPGEADDTLTARFPFLRWIPDNTTQISRDELVEDIGKEYPESSPWARADLADVLMNYDKPWAGGDGNGKVGRSELSGIGLILGFIAGTDLSQPLTIPGDDQTSQLITSTLEGKLNQQLYGKSTQLEYTSLSPADLTMEWMQLAAKFYLVDHLTHFYDKANGLIDLKTQAADALSQLGPDEHGHWAELRSLYGNQIMGGHNGGGASDDGKLNSIESFAFLADLEYAQRVFDAAGGDVSAAGINKMDPDAKKQLLADLMVVLPLTGQQLTMADLIDPWNPWAVRADFWDGLKLYDQPDYGGDGNGKLDVGEFAMGLADCRITENLFALYDTNNDGMLSKDEVRPLFAKLGLTDSRLIDAFFANVGLDGHDVGFWQKLKMFFGGGGSKIDKLGPYEFYVRLVKVMPRVQNPPPPNPRRAD